MPNSLIRNPTPADRLIEDIQNSVGGAKANLYATFINVRQMLWRPAIRKDDGTPFSPQEALDLLGPAGVQLFIFSSHVIELFRVLFNEQLSGLPVGVQYDPASLATGRVVLTHVPDEIRFADEPE